MAVYCFKSTLVIQSSVERECGVEGSSTLENFKQFASRLITFHRKEDV